MSEEDNRQRGFYEPLWRFKTYYKDFCTNHPSIAHHFQSSRVLYLLLFVCLSLNLELVLFAEDRGFFSNIFNISITSSILLSFAFLAISIGGFIGVFLIYATISFLLFEIIVAHIVGTYNNLMVSAIASSGEFFHF